MTALFIEVALKSSILLVIVATAHALVYRRTSAATRHLDAGSRLRAARQSCQTERDDQRV
jgi:hypothetical protein